MSMPSFRKPPRLDIKEDRLNIEEASVVDKNIRETLRKVADDAKRIPDEVRRYAPPVHPDMVSSTTRIMCEAIEKICAHTSEGIDSRVSDLAAKVAEVKRGVEDFESKMRMASEQLVRQLEAKAEEAGHSAGDFKQKMSSAADRLIHQIQTAMVMYEDTVGKMRESPFNNIASPVEPPSLRITHEEPKPEDTE